ncbi:leucine-rich repeat-containing protein 16hypothetical protein [Limosa lapponica baueri]|uniref:CARMIL C-terminal domain-containing protein n=1 Tax=Limosa lapponica baueri TaxID=1758121 RepID=A0A2I0TEL8_LIMLA|nr:leucine-rich repeat-containing protein 16hypothetical protein [Limosa lapponica baueri]
MGTLVFSEGIIAFLGTKKILLVMSIQLQVKSKYDDYILVVIETDAASYAFRFMCFDDLEQVVIHVTMSLKKVFPDSSPGTLLKNSPPNLYERIRQVTDSLEEMLQSSPGPCGGFSETYAALCDYNGFAFREEIQDVALSVAALSFNLWFTKLSCKDFRLNQEISEQLLYMLSKSVTLEELVLENSGLKADFAQRMAQALSNHPDSVLHTINLAGNQLEDRGIVAFSRHVEKNPKGLQSLSLARTMLSAKGFDPDMVTLVLSIGRSKSIRHVSLGKNFNIKSKEGLLDVLHRIVQLIQEDDCPLQSLSVAESRLKLGTNVLLSALGSNTSLVTLDISGNAMGDTGAKMLAKALQINTKLRTVVWDRNNTTAHGLLEVAQALERNYTLKSMPLPMSDVAQAYRSSPERTEEAVHKLQSCLTRNQLRRTLPTQTFRLQQGILTTSSEQMVNEICLSVQKHVDILSASCSAREVEADILCAEEAIRNANLSISILPLLYEVGNTPYQNGKLQHKLECLTEEASQTCGREIQAIMQAVLDTAHSLCPAVVQKSGVRDQLVNAMSERIYLQDHLNLSTVLDQMVTDVFSKLNEIKLSVTAAVADCIVDAVLGDLTVAQCKLCHPMEPCVPLGAKAGVVTSSEQLVAKFCFLGFWLQLVFGFG